ncbi:hypothetical protein SE17_07705 [Kouleothrix aurantiaca]|uniref:Uncharacterized protein n=1 Tax=Kouleothrix aurantiaca TaxID=186479 RepID=A0A0P9D3V5_9CHLR|nr:hypothetical protein SE17_07705 [Kouleothrix aurantiaca]
MSAYTSIAERLEDQTPEAGGAGAAGIITTDLLAQSIEYYRGRGFDPTRYNITAAEATKIADWYRQQLVSAVQAGGGTIRITGQTITARLMAIRGLGRGN